MNSLERTKLLIGIDNASKTGVVVYNPLTDSIIRQVLIEVDKRKNIIEQLTYLYDVIQAIVRPYVESYEVRVFTESPYLHIVSSAGRAPMYINTFGRLKGIEAVIQVACAKLGVSVQSVAIRAHQAHTKKVLNLKISGREAIKRAFQQGFSQRYGIDFQSNDVSDALSIVLFGASLLTEEKE